MSMSEMMALWSEYRRQPMDWVHPSWVEQCFDPVRLSGSHLEEILGRQRFQPRLVQLLMEHHALPEIPELDTPSESDLAVILCPLLSMDRLVRSCGVVYWAKAFSTVVLSSQVTELRNRFGPDLYRLALGNRELGVATSTPETLDELEAAIEADGLQCLRSWLVEQAPQLQAWMKLKLPYRLLEDAGIGSSRAGAHIARHIAYNLWPKQELMEVQDDRVNG